MAYDAVAGVNVNDVAALDVAEKLALTALVAFTANEADSMDPPAARRLAVAAKTAADAVSAKCELDANKVAVLTFTNNDCENAVSAEMPEPPVTLTLKVRLLHV
jgi:hypothetical protein